MRSRTIVIARGLVLVADRSGNPTEPTDASPALGVCAGVAFRV